MDVPTQDVALEGTVVIDAPWGRARFSPRHDCFVRVLAIPAPIALHPPGPRVLASSSTWIAVEDTVGVTVAALLATASIDAIDARLRRLIWQVAGAGLRHAVARTDQIWLGFDGHLAITVPPGDRHGDDRGLLALALDVDPRAPASDDAFDDAAQRDIAALVARLFPAQARAFDEARTRARAAAAPPPPPDPVGLARQRLRACLDRPLSIPPGGFIALPAAIDGDDDRGWQGWRASSAPPAPPTSADLAFLNDAGRLRRITAAFAHVLEALAGAADFVSVGTPFDVRLTVDGCDFHDDQTRRAAAPPVDDSRAPPFHFRYVPPEQAVGESLDIRASLYVVGVHLYEALAGRHPYWSESAVGFAYQHARKAPPPLVAWNPRVHPGLAAVALRLLQKKPADRFAHPDEVIVALARAIDGSS